MSNFDLFQSLSLDSSDNPRGHIVHEDLNDAIAERPVVARLRQEHREGWDLPGAPAGFRDDLGVQFLQLSKTTESISYFIKNILKILYITI